MDRATARIGAVLALLVSAFGSATYADDAPPPVFSRRTDFRLPVQVAEADRETLQELKLYVRQLPGAWACAASGPPSQATFSYRAPADGEYWFTFVSVDSNGRPDPADPARVEAGLRVVVDTIPPEADLEPVPLANGSVMLRCTVRDSHPDYRTLKVEYLGDAGLWNGMEPLGPDSPGLFPVKDQRILKGKVRLFIADLAGNVRNLEFDLSGPPKAVRDLTPPKPQPIMPVSTTKSPPPPPPPEFPKLDFAPSVVLQPAPTIAPPPAPMLVVEAPKPAPPLEEFPKIVPPMPTPVVETPKRVPLEFPKMVPPMLTPVVERPKPAPPLEFPKMVPPMPTPVVELTPPPAVPPRPMLPPSTLPTSFDEPPVVRQSPPANGAATINPGEVQVLNTTRFALDYAVDEVRPGSPARIEFWSTKDRGRTWDRLGEDADRRSPAELNLPGDGLFGVTLRVANGPNSVPPLAGENPDFWLEVDTTKPVASLLPPTIGTGPEAGTMMILWTASDRGLEPDPISLSYTTTPNGPWTAMAKGIRNEGFYRWQVPAELSQVYLRLEVKDRAGNVARVESKTPVVITPQPKIRVYGVTPARMPGLE